MTSDVKTKGMGMTRRGQKGQPRAPRIVLMHLTKIKRGAKYPERSHRTQGHKEREVAAGRALGVRTSGGKGREREVEKKGKPDPKQASTHPDQIDLEDGKAGQDRVSDTHTKVTPCSGAKG